MAEQNSGLITCCRYSYPPNSLSLCGPDRTLNLQQYSIQGIYDAGTRELISQFSTLFPYLTLIAVGNSVRDPLDRRVVEAYWLGNSLLYNVRKRSFFKHLSDTLRLKQKLGKKDLNLISFKFNLNPLPQHAFHVFNVYKRTGNLDIPQTVETMDACIINYGKVMEIQKDSVKIKTQRLKIDGQSIFFEKNIERNVKFQGEKDLEAIKLKQGDFVSYHWGIFCKKISLRQQINLEYFNNLALSMANIH